MAACLRLTHLNIQIITRRVSLSCFTATNLLNRDVIDICGAPLTAAATRMPHSNWNSSTNFWATRTETWGNRHYFILVLFLSCLICLKKQTNHSRFVWSCISHTPASSETPCESVWRRLSLSEEWFQARVQRAPPFRCGKLLCSISQHVVQFCYSLFPPPL